MQSISIEHPTPKQLLKLRRGEKVRIRHGEGFNVLVHPNTYNLVARAFNKGNAYTYGMSEDELKANSSVSSGIQELTPKVIAQYDETGALMPVPPAPVRQQGPQAMNVGGRNQMVGHAGQQVHVGGAPAQVVHPGAHLPVQGHGIMNNKYSGKSGLTHAHAMKDLAGQVHMSKVYEKANQELGTNFDYLNRAGIDKAVADSISAKLSEASFQARHRPADESIHTLTHSMRGSGFGLSQSRHTHITGKGVMSREVMPPAFESQPHSANFQFNHFLPPEFQSEKHIHGGTIGAHQSKKHPHNYSDEFPESVVMPSFYTSKADDVDFVRQSTKNPESKPEAKHRKNKAIRKAKTGSGLYAGGHGHGFGLGP